MSLPRRVRYVLLACAFGVSALAVPRAEGIVADPPWGWHVSTPSEAVVGMFVIPIGAAMVAGFLLVLPVLPPGGPVRTDDYYEWRVTALVAVMVLVHLWAMLPVFGVYLL